VQTKRVNPCAERRKKVDRGWVDCITRRTRHNMQRPTPSKAQRKRWTSLVIITSHLSLDLNPNPSLSISLSSLEQAQAVRLRSASRKPKQALRVRNTLANSEVLSTPRTVSQVNRLYLSVWNNAHIPCHRSELQRVRLPPLRVAYSDI
jgi:hypothetical protein